MTTDSDEKHKQTLRELGILLDTALNPDGAPRFCFCLLITEFDDGSDVANEDSRMNYISNATREDMVAALKEFIDRVEGYDKSKDTLN